MSSRTFCQEKFFNSSASSASVSVTACDDGGAFLAQKIAVVQPDHLAGAEKGQRLQGLAKPGETFSASPLLETRGFDDFVVHAAQFVGPLLDRFASRAV